LCSAKAQKTHHHVLDHPEKDETDQLTRQKLAAEDLTSNDEKRSRQRQKPGWEKANEAGREDRN